MADDGAVIQFQTADGYPGDIMNQRDLIELGKRYFIFDADLSMANLIRKIQKAEGHVVCFAMGKNSCDQTACQWRKDCLPESAEDAPVDS